MCEASPADTSVDEIVEDREEKDRDEAHDQEVTKLERKVSTDLSEQKSPHCDVIDRVGGVAPQPGGVDSEHGCLVWKLLFSSVASLVTSLL